MKQTILFLFVAFGISTGIAQETREYKANDKKFKVTGEQSFKPVKNANQEEFFNIVGSTLYVYTVSFIDGNQVFSLKTQTVKLEDLDFKNYTIHDMNTGSTNPHIAWYLTIDTKKKKTCRLEMDIFYGEPGVDEMPHVGITFNSKDAAQKAYEKFKAAAAK
jgi:hypothetical protein